MNRKYCRSILGIFALSAIGAANAATVTLGTHGPGKKLDIGDTGLVRTTLVPSGSSFTDNFYFRLVSASQLSANVTNIPLLGFGFSSLSAELIDTTTHKVVDTGLNFTLPSLAGGDHYDLRVWGTSSTPLGGIFAGAVHVAAAVPIPAAVWLLLSGLVGVGAIGRRRKSEVVS